MRAITCRTVNLRAGLDGLCRQSHIKPESLQALIASLQPAASELALPPRHIWGFPKTRGTLFGVLIIRILLFRVLY